MNRIWWKQTGKSGGCRSAVHQPVLMFYSCKCWGEVKYLSAMTTMRVNGSVKDRHFMNVQLRFVNARARIVLGGKRH